MARLDSTVAAEAGNLRRALKRVIADAEDALGRLDAGQRPGLSITGGILSGSADDVERHSARLNLLLDWVGSELVSVDKVTDLMKGDLG